MRKFRRRPSIEILETRSLLSGGGWAAQLAASGQLTAFEHVPGGPRPALITGIGVSGQTVLGNTVMMTLIDQPGVGYRPNSTTWTYQVVYDDGIDYHSPVVSLAGTTLTASLTCSVPGDYMVQSVTTYISTNPITQPPGPTTENISWSILPPDTIAKGGAVGVPTSTMMAVQLVDPVTADGVSIGPNPAGMIQEHFPAARWWNGDQWAERPWGPSAPSFQFSFWSSALHDQQALFIGAPGDWNNAPNGQVLINLQQDLRYTWQMSTLEAGDMVFHAPLNSLAWQWIKVNANTWEDL
jgi:hypothetical protein